MSARKMTGGETVIASLEALGIETVFGIPGGHSVPLYGGLLRKTKIRHILGRHEQGLAYMADGYYRASGKIAAVLATSGPAVANMTAAMGGATTDTSSILVVASAVRSDLIGKNRGALHDLGDTLEITRPVCREVRRCTSVAEIPLTLLELYTLLRNGRPGAVFCEIPTDVLSDRAYVAVERSLPVLLRGPSPEEAKQAAALLAKAERPVIWAGTGVTVSESGTELIRLAERLGAVVVTSALGRGIIPPDHNQFIMNDGGRYTEVDECISRADVVLAVGTMFKSEDTAGWKTRMGERLIHIDIDPEEIGRSYPPTLGIVADAKAALTAIYDQLPQNTFASVKWKKRAKEAEKAFLLRRISEQPAEMKILDLFRDALPKHSIIVSDRCSLGYWIWRCLPAEQPRSFLYPLGYGGLGGALPQAIGAKIAAPDRPVVCIIGDGGVQFTMTELAVAVQEQVAITIVLCNNQMYGAIAAAMQLNFGTAEIGCKLVNPDFGQISRAYGIPFLRVDTVANLSGALRSAIGSGRLNVLEITVPIADPHG